MPCAWRNTDVRQSFSHQGAHTFEILFLDKTYWQKMFLLCNQNLPKLETFNIILFSHICKKFSLQIEREAVIKNP